MVGPAATSTHTDEAGLTGVPGSPPGLPAATGPVETARGANAACVAVVVDMPVSHTTAPPNLDAPRLPVRSRGRL
ncbi:hypothetical protein Acsp05_60340 [Actinokineospora sp. NBRC 105648]|nr:hypothetical protein Acsp05_60340 [Actinokineospora sp. NBRC 105648]